MLCPLQCHGAGVPPHGSLVPPDSGQLAELTQDLVQRREELVGGEETQVPLMEPIHFEKVPAQPERLVAASPCGTPMSP